MPRQKTPADRPASATYLLFREAMLEQKQIACVYNGHVRRLCPVILGHTGDDEMVLAYQVAGGGSKPLPHGGKWKCLSLAKVQQPEMAEGPWREGERHERTQTCVRDVDIDINIHVRKRRA